MSERLTKLLIVIFVAFGLLLHYPLVTVANIPSHINGIPIFLIYLLISWTLLILSIFLIVKKSSQ